MPRKRARTSRQSTSGGPCYDCESDASFESEVPPNKRQKLEDFDTKMKKLSNVILIVEDEKFYAVKAHLAAHSDVFEAMFFGANEDPRNEEVGKTVIELEDTNAADFQNLLDLMNGIDSIDENTVEGILSVAAKYKDQIALGRCEKFLLETYKKSRKEKFQLATKYRLDDLLNKCISESWTVESLRSLLPNKAEDLDTKTMGLCFQRFLDLPQTSTQPSPSPPLELPAHELRRRAAILKRQRENLLRQVRTPSGSPPEDD